MDDEERQAHRRRLLLASALELFGDNGYARTSVESLCQHAGVGTNSFYELFPNKEQLLIELYDSLSAALRDAVVGVYTRDADDPEGPDDRVRAMVAAFVRAATDDPRVAKVLFLQSAGVSAEMERHRRQTREAFIVGLETIGTALLHSRGGGIGGPAGERPVGPSARRNAVAVVGAIIEMTVDWLHDAAPDPVEQLIDDISVHCTRVLLAAAGDH